MKKQKTPHTPKLLQTNNYELFAPHEFQQMLSTKHVRALAESMRAHGFWPGKPLMVWRDSNGRLHLIDGHHRLEAAKLVEVWVFYVIVEEECKELIGAANQIVKVWPNRQFVEMYAAKGLKDYITLKAYCGRGIPLDSLAGLMLGEGVKSGLSAHKIRTGKFRIHSTETVDRILHLFEHVGKLCPDIHNVCYVYALAALDYLEDFDWQVFEDRLMLNTPMVVKVPNRDYALKVIEDIYNFRAHKKINLSFLAKEALQMRNPVGRKMVA